MADHVLRIGERILLKNKYSFGIYIILLTVNNDFSSYGSYLFNQCGKGIGRGNIMKRKFLAQEIQKWADENFAVKTTTTILFSIII